jgi:hypothetical protein
MQAETARAARDTAVTRLNTYAAGLTADASGAYFVSDADLAEMARLIGYDSSGKTADQIRQSIAGYDAADLVGSTIYDPTGSQEAAYLAAQQFPAFARGGSHDGGPAYIGENDLELVAPSRVYNPSETRSMLDNRQVVEELRALREELRALKDESRQLGLQTADNTRSIAKITRKWDAIGQPPVQETNP